MHSESGDSCFTGDARLAVWDARSSRAPRRWSGMRIPEQDVLVALGAVVDPERNEPITDLDFVRSLEVDGGRVTVHLWLPTSFCAPNLAYLTASDVKDVLTDLSWTRAVTVELDDHHDSEVINRGLAADAGHRGALGADELLLMFRRKAHAAALERVLIGMLRADPGIAETELHRVTIADLPAGGATRALLRRRAALGLGSGGALPVLVDENGRPYQAGEIPLWLRRARFARVPAGSSSRF
ncbi:metal-sulfur cluster biosynthetic enzyme [Saccharopolyspora lacisalsi]|uniref:Metal-sulfur cluster biosynthetic enzyme n=1 Tax=Halosaccharopolyspora lacisalsi TaxID=1000566 RepID=A0A839E043_9PSEU|nr:iron-sulfur cluster assembly protein [Halosaccharopolyspora lacisalsi]MBA8826289.1 metal-sulfur cluster biosynthetic enzyme [Halosaccharopolyspora lacisalsi]